MGELDRRSHKPLAAPSGAARGRGSRVGWLVTGLVRLVALASVLGAAKPADAGGTLERSGVDAAALTTSPVAQPKTRPLVVIRAAAGVRAGHAVEACRVLTAQYPLRCEVRAAEGPASVRAGEGFDKVRGQLDARSTLEQMFRRRTDHALVELYLTDVDMYERRRPYVFGLASLTDRVAVVSLARIERSSGSDRHDHGAHGTGPVGAQAFDEAGRGDRTHARLAKLVLHEVGHALGLRHHDHAGCVMRQDATVASLDTAPMGLCAACHAELTRATSLLARPGQATLDRIRGHLVRGEPELAAVRLARLERARGADGAVLNEAAIAFYRAGELDAAIEVFERAIGTAPELAEAHANVAVALSVRAAEGDLGRAVRHLRRALSLKQDWPEVREPLADLLAAPRPIAQGPQQR